MADIHGGQVGTERLEHPRPRDLADWLLARGRHWITVEEAARLLDIPERHVAPTLARWRHRGLLFSPTTGAYVPIPPQYRSWRVVPAAHFIDPLMRHLGHDYYVALLSAAQARGIAHQAPQVFQVMTTARLRDRQFGRVRIQFITSARVPDRATTTRINTPTGTMVVSTPAVTALDLVAFPLYSGGLSNVVTVLGEMLAESILDVALVADAAIAYPASVVQRAGWLLEQAAADLGMPVDLGPLEARARRRSTPTPLASSGERRGPLDRRWNVLVNTPVESDL